MGQKYDGACSARHCCSERNSDRFRVLPVSGDSVTARRRIAPSILPISCRNKTSHTSQLPQSHPSEWAIISASWQWRALSHFSCRPFQVRPIAEHQTTCIDGIFSGCSTTSRRHACGDRPAAELRFSGRATLADALRRKRTPQYLLASFSFSTCGPPHNSRGDLDEKNSRLVRSGRVLHRSVHDGSGGP